MVMNVCWIMISCSCEQIFNDGDVDPLRVMINKGIVDMNIKDGEGMNVLQKAAQGGHVALVKALLECGGRKWQKRKQREQTDQENEKEAQNKEIRLE